MMENQMKKKMKLKFESLLEVKAPGFGFGFKAAGS